jgi:hypothetical protein
VGAKRNFCAFCAFLCAENQGLKNGFIFSGNCLKSGIGGENMLCAVRSGGAPWPRRTAPTPRPHPHRAADNCHTIHQDKYLSN